MDGIPTRCFTDPDHIVLTSTYYSTEAVLHINIHTGEVSKLNSALQLVFYETPTDPSAHWNNPADASYQVRYTCILAHLPYIYDIYYSSSQVKPSQ